MALIYKRAGHVAFLYGSNYASSADDAVFVADLNSSEVYTFGGSAGFIWEILDVQKSFEQVCQEVAEIFGENQEIVAPAVRSFIDDLVGRGLLEEVEK